MLLLKERRVEKRLQVHLPVTYEYPIDHEIVTKNSSTFDISDSGLCFYTDRHFKKGHNLKVRLDGIWENPKESMVQWCARKKVGLYKVGIIFQ
jgi:hypothetical protein